MAFKPRTKNAAKIPDLYYICLHIIRYLIVAFKHPITLSGSRVQDSPRIPMQKTALVTGVTGQDGAYLSRYLLQRGYRVVGAHRATSIHSRSRLACLGIEEHIE